MRTGTASDPLRVGINAYLLTSPAMRGWNRYMANLAAALPAHGVRPVLYSTGPIHPVHLSKLPPDTFEVRVAPPMRYPAWEQWWLPRQAKADRLDVLHSPFNYGLPLVCPVPRVLTLHDAIDQIYYSPKIRWRERWTAAGFKSRFHAWAARRAADHVITDSEHARATWRGTWVFSRTG
jgi:hypothetical protein